MQKKNKFRNLSQSGKQCEPVYDGQQFASTEDCSTKYDENNELSCTQCDRKLPTEASLRIHLNSVHGIRKKAPPGECLLCGIDFGDAVTMASHKVLHLMNSNFQCIECDLVFPRSRNLKLHMRTHVRVSICFCRDSRIRAFALFNLSPDWGEAISMSRMSVSFCTQNWPEFSQEETCKFESVLSVIFSIRGRRGILARVIMLISHASKLSNPVRVTSIDENDVERNKLQHVNRLKARRVCPEFLKCAVYLINIVREEPMLISIDHFQKIRTHTVPEETDITTPPTAYPTCKICGEHFPSSMTYHVNDSQTFNSSNFDTY